MAYVDKALNKDYVKTPFINSIINRSQNYLEAGFPVHFSGPAGTGKTTLALITALALGKPVIVTYGNDDFSHTDLIGSVVGFKKQIVRDNYVHSVMKSTDVFTTSWIDGAITRACKNGYTLIYDEFTRSRPEANNVLLSVLEEKVMHLPNLAKGEKEIEVHPEFRVIFTSNPEEYAGVHKTQDALKDRMITLDLGEFDEETETKIVQLKSGVQWETAQKITALVRGFRSNCQHSFKPTVRAGIMIASVVSYLHLDPDRKNPHFCQIVSDILMSTVLPHKNVPEIVEAGGKYLFELLNMHCS
ncbi:gas vesicle protein GvpN [Candidatus Formimonas warabiya]|uniref:gas vesicle protein GvpN n=1 Tax=Formimonas warabiya TaxID=1761012 RepID=UPI001BE45180|nr:gas vesicle protein GvpN [Candidatus Formimonas warabiya]